MRSTRSRRHQKRLNRDLKDAKASSGNAEKAVEENAPLDPAKVEAEDDLIDQTMADRAETGSGEENVVDRQG
jgi:hypothetical protein